MANTRGGVIVIGFDRRNYHLLGTEINEADINTLISRTCYPLPDYTFKIYVKNEKKYCDYVY